MPVFPPYIFFNCALLAWGSRPAYAGNLDASLRKNKLSQLRLAIDRTKSAIQEQRYRSELEQIEERKTSVSSMLESDSRVESIVRDRATLKLKAGRAVKCRDSRVAKVWKYGVLSSVSPAKCKPNGWSTGFVFPEIALLQTNEHPMGEAEMGGDLSDEEIDAEEGGDLPVPQEGESPVLDSLDEKLIGPDGEPDAVKGHKVPLDSPDAQATKGFMAESWPECDIQQDETIDTDRVVAQLAECTARLKREAEDTSAAHEKSKQANYAYSLKFRNAVNLLGELGDLEKVKRALHSDHGKVRNNLVGRVNTINSARQMRDYALPTHMFTESSGGGNKQGRDNVYITEADETSKRMPAS